MDRGEVSDHARVRLCQRLGQFADPEVVLNALWAGGRIARRADFLSFGTYPKRGRAYRVAILRGEKIIIVREGTRFVTVILKKK